MDGNGIDIDPPTSAIVVSVYDFPADSPVLESGIYLYATPQDTQPIKISGEIGARVFFGASNQVYIGSEAPIIYDIQTNLATPDTAILRYVYGSGYNTYFTEGTDGARAYYMNPDGTLSIQDNIMPNNLLSSLRYVDAPSNMYFMGFVPHHYQGQMGSNSVSIGSLANPITTKQVSIGEGNFILDVAIVFGG